MECLGGNGYVEESVLPRLYREAPVNAIWEGSGNVMCLDVLRALARDGEAARAVLTALGEETADLPGARAALAFIERGFSGPEGEAQARAAVDGLALLAAAAALRQSARPRSRPCSRARGSRIVTAPCTERAASLPRRRAGSSTAPCRRLE